MDSDKIQSKQDMNLVFRIIWISDASQELRSLVEKKILLLDSKAERNIRVALIVCAKAGGFFLILIAILSSRTGACGENSLSMVLKPFFHQNLKYTFGFEDFSFSFMSFLRVGAFKSMPKPRVQLFRITSGEYDQATSPHLGTLQCMCASRTIFHKQRTQSAFANLSEIFAIIFIFFPQGV